MTAKIPDGGFRREVLFAGCNLTPMQCRQLRGFAGDASGGRFDFDASLIVWTGLALKANRDIDYPGWIFLMSTAGPYLRESGPPIRRLLEGGDWPASLPRPQIVIADGRYAAWPTAAGYWDLTTGELAEGLDPPPVITVCYHLDALAARSLARCVAQERKDATTGDASGEEGR